MGFDALSEILGMEKSAIPAEKEEGGGLIAAIKAVDWRYQVWQVGVTVTDSTFLYLIFYFVFSPSFATSTRFSLSTSSANSTLLRVRRARIPIRCAMTSSPALSSTCIRVSGPVVALET